MTEFRCSNAVGIDDVELPPDGAESFAAFDCVLQLLDIFRLAFEKHDEKVARILFRFARKRVLRDDGLQLVRRSYKELRFDAEPLPDF